MIKLFKNAEPEVLSRNAVRWTEELLKVHANGGDEKATRLARYRHEQIKAALIRETHEKCAYCESKPLAVAYGDIEHVVPKAARPDLAFAWNNLTLACDRCNTNKSDYEGAIDPYMDDPEAEFEFFGPMILHRTGRDKAERTIARLGLNRIQLLERRADHIGRLRSLIDRLAATSDPKHHAFLQRQIVDAETSDEKEYAGCARAFVAAVVGSRTG